MLCSYNTFDGNLGPGDDLTYPDEKGKTRVYKVKHCGNGMLTLIPYLYCNELPDKLKSKYDMPKCLAICKADDTYPKERAIDITKLNISVLRCVKVAHPTWSKTADISDCFVCEIGYDKKHKKVTIILVSCMLKID